MVINIFIFIKKLKQTIDYCLFFCYYLFIKIRRMFYMKMFEKLNRKGFTLIELLAVIVILAIVMGISATSVLNSINNSRRSSLYSNAQSVANTLNTWVGEDMLITDDIKQHLGTGFITYTQTTMVNKWICIGYNATASIQNGGSSTTLVKALKLSDKDLVFSTANVTTAGIKITNGVLEHTNENLTPGCSAIKYNSSTGGYEVLLVAKNAGRYYVSSDSIHYAYSSADAGNKKPSY